VFLTNPHFSLPNQFFFESMLHAIYGPICKCANFFWWKKILNVSNVKLLSIFFSTFFVFLFFCFQALIKCKQVSIYCFFTFYCLKQPLKLKIFQNSLRNKRCLQNGPQMACNINSIKADKKASKKPKKR
jgi:hypothetical protein